MWYGKTHGWYWVAGITLRHWSLEWTHERGLVCLCVGPLVFEVEAGNR
jgi:hypothetical protein